MGEPIDDNDLIQLELALGYHFADRDLLLMALTHRSWVEERFPGGDAPAHLAQQRLEFLGDALLNYVVARWLFKALPEADEGELTVRRTEFTRGDWLHSKGATLGLDRLVRRGRGEAANAANRKLPEDTMEALIGAILLDGGDQVATELILSWLPEQPPAMAPEDPIIAFGKWHQANVGGAPPEPSYTASGPDHARVWTARIEVRGVAAEGTGATKQEAKRDTLRLLMDRLGEP